MDRRKFLQQSAISTVAAMISPAHYNQAARANNGVNPAPPLTELDTFRQLVSRDYYGRVIQVHDLIPSGFSPRSNLDPLPAPRLSESLERGMGALFGNNPWTALFSSTDTVAIKINGLAAGHLSPRPALIDAIATGLQSAGVKAGNIIIWERTSRELKRCGFTLQQSASAVRVYGTDALKGGGYSRNLESFRSIGSLPSRILSDYATALINVGVLKDHNLAGISAGMKNLYGVIHNPNRYHDNNCDPYLADILGLPSIRRCLRLTIIDAILAQADGGPAFSPDWIWPSNSLLLAIDPVACDQVAWDIIEQERFQRGLPSLTEVKRHPSWLAVAASGGWGRHQGLELEDV